MSLMLNEESRYINSILEIKNNKIKRKRLAAKVECQRRNEECFAVLNDCADAAF